MTELYDLIFWAILLLWGGYLTYGVVGCVRSGKGNINWWVWPPVALTILPFAVLIFLFDFQIAKMGVVILNAGAVAASIIAWKLTINKPS